MNGDSPPGAAVLVCGLGKLGQQCVVVLKEFGVRVTAIERSPTQTWEIPDFQKLLDQLVVGDCRQSNLLLQAGIRSCQTVLLVTDDEQANVEAAFAARSLNAHVRLVMRSGQQNLNQLLGKSLGNFVAYEATQLPANAFALAAMGDEMLGFFSLDNRVLQVVTTEVHPGHRWCDRRLLHELNTANRRLLSHTPAELAAANEFYQWSPDARIRAGDTVVHIELKEGAIAVSPGSRVALPKRQTFRQRLRTAPAPTLKQWLIEFWQSSRTRRATVLCGATVVILLLLGTLILRGYRDIPLKDAFFATALLLLGGYGDLFGGFEQGVPWGIQLFSLLLALAGTAFVGVLYALLTESLLRAEFQLLKRRPPIPDRDHVVLIGIGRVGQRVATLLQELKQPIVGVSSGDLEPGILPQLPLVVGNLTTAIDRVNIADAKSIVVATDDQVKNLEIGLMARAANPQCSLVIRVFSQRFSENVSQLLPYAKVLGAYALAAEAFAAAAFGEHIISLFRLNNQTILVTEYRVETDDSLCGRLLAEVAYGYGIVPVLYQRPREPIKLMPSDDTRLRAGDRLIVLAPIEGLQRIERGIQAAKGWRIRVERSMSEEAAFEGANAIARVSGCEIGVARSLMSQLPGTLPVPLYRHQALRLVRELSKTQVTAHLVRG